MNTKYDVAYTPRQIADTLSDDDGAKFRVEARNKTPE
jgi:hypothetical protein